MISLPYTQLKQLPWPEVLLQSMTAILGDQCVKIQILDCAIENNQINHFKINFEYQKLTFSVSAVSFIVFISIYNVLTVAIALLTFGVFKEVPAIGSPLLLAASLLAFMLLIFDVLLLILGI
jgi:hypothetical protein